MSKRKRLRKLMQLQAAATIRQLPAPVNSVPAPAQPEASSSPTSKQKALTLLWDMLHQKLQSVTNTPDLTTCAKLIERFMRIELAERKQDHAERKLALAREKQELAAKKFALAQLK
ncbi:MAG: hypothetical protein SFY81_12470, partial [Verrucomicrobiota bacterium]|nr:hypothetical protein [Verrucomicrobiota bacterium]